MTAMHHKINFITFCDKNKACN